MAYDGEVFISKKKHEEIYVVIKGIHYKISSQFSPLNYKVFISRFSETNDFKKAIASVIYEKISKENTIIPIPSLAEIEQEDENVFITFVTSVVENNEEIKECYDGTDSKLPIIERFVIAYKAYSEMSIENMRNALANIVKNIDYSPMMDGLQQMSKMMTKLFSSIDFSVIVKNMQRSLQSFGKAFSDIIDKLQVPDISDEKKKELKISYKTWGKYGWTSIPNAPDGLFYTVPQDVFEANKIAGLYCKTKDMEYLFSLIRQQKLNKVDLESAIFCYKQGHYKACALMLFSLIDAKMIKKHRKRNSKSDLPVGIEALNMLRNHFYRIDNNTLSLFVFLQSYNLFNCLEEMFKTVKGFSKEPPIINRNVALHGMSRRRMRKMDCKQLFLALYNLNDFIEVLHEYGIVSK